MTPLVVTTVEIDDPGPLLDLVPEVAVAAAGGRGAVAWIRDGDCFVGWGEAARLDAGVGDDRFARAEGWWRQLVAEARVSDPIAAPGSGPVAFASLTFDARSAGSVVVVPAVLVARREGRSWVTVAGRGSAPVVPDLAVQPPPRSTERIRYAGSSMPDLHWLEAVATAVERIRAGALDKVVLARDHAVWAREPFDARVLLQRLAQRFPDCFTFLCDGLVGATPELLVRRLGRRVESIVLAGSARREAEAAADADVGAALLASAKDRSEHEMAAASVAEVLTPRCEELAVDEEPWLLRLANVQHLATRFRGELRATDGRVASAFALVAALHPTAAVGGTPTAAAVALIRELEGMDRGRYAGPVGWVDARGDGEFGIALRCAELSGARARLFAGSGIVAASLPEAELEETRLKLRAMQSAFEG